MPDEMDDTDGPGPVLCSRCGEAEGTGLACVECAKVRIARNQPRTDDVWTTRTGKQPAMDGITNILPAGTGGEKNGKAKQGGTDMRLPMRKPGEGMPPLRQEKPGPTRGRGRPRGSGHRPVSLCPDCGVRTSGPWRCRKCAGIARRKAGAASPEPGAASEDRRLVRAAAPAPAPLRAVVPAPGPAAADAPGPLTLAVCNFFGEVARASDHIEARMVLDRRKLSITVELALPGEPVGPTV